MHALENTSPKIPAWHSTEPEILDVSECTRTAHSLHYYDSVMVIEKRPTEKRSPLKTGKPAL